MVTWYLYTKKRKQIIIFFPHLLWETGLFLLTSMDTEKVSDKVQRKCWSVCMKFEFPVRFSSQVPPLLSFYNSFCNTSMVSCCCCCKSPNQPLTNPVFIRSQSSLPYWLFRYLAVFAVNTLHNKKCSVADMAEKQEQHTDWLYKLCVNINKVNEINWKNKCVSSSFLTSSVLL